MPTAGGIVKLYSADIVPLSPMTCKGSQYNDIGNKCMQTTLGYGQLPALDQMQVIL